MEVWGMIMKNNYDKGGRDHQSLQYTEREKHIHVQE